MGNLWASLLSGHGGCCLDHFEVLDFSVKNIGHRQVGPVPDLSALEGETKLPPLRSWVDAPRKTAKVEQ